jgi:hypothetical protein
MVGRGSVTSGRLVCTQRRKDAEVLGSRGAGEQGCSGFGVSATWWIPRSTGWSRRMPIVIPAILIFAVCWSFSLDFNNFAIDFARINV